MSKFKKKRNNVFEKKESAITRDSSFINKAKEVTVNVRWYRESSKECYVNGNSFFTNLLPKHCSSDVHIALYDIHSDFNAIVDKQRYDTKPIHKVPDTHRSYGVFEHYLQEDVAKFNIEDVENGLFEIRKLNSASIGYAEGFRIFVIYSVSKDSGSNVEVVFLDPFHLIFEYSGSKVSIEEKFKIHIDNHLNYSAYVSKHF